MRWEVVSSHPNYSVSDTGLIRNNTTGSIRKPVFNPHRGGYYQCILYKEGKSKMCYPHRLVAIAFIDNTDNKPQVNHIDGNKLNNCVDNLEWVTNQENGQHAFDTGLNKNKGVNSNFSKFTDEEIRDILSYKDTGKSQGYVSRKLRVSQSYISMLWNGKSSRKI